MKVITISGKAQAGKDTTAKILKDKLEGRGHKVLITHYADLLKYQAKTLFGWNGIKDEAGRTLLQKLGTDTVRKKNPYYWIHYIVDMLWIYEDVWDYVIIPDARFENEIEIMKMEYECISVKVMSDFDNGLSDEQKKHPSETALDDYKFDYVLWNDRTQSGLEQVVEGFLNKIGETK